MSKNDDDGAAWDALFPVWSYGLGGDCDECGDRDASISEDKNGRRRCEYCSLSYWHMFGDE
jgi:hypothetical protein